jgi:hypothetical protein
MGVEFFFARLGGIVPSYFSGNELTRFTAACAWLRIVHPVKQAIHLSEFMLAYRAFNPRVPGKTIRKIHYEAQNNQSLRER